MKTSPQNSPFLNKFLPGFTLIELLIVLGIVIILATLLFPMINALRDRALGAGCVANLHTAAGAITSYAAENGGILPSSTMYTYPQVDVKGEPYGELAFTECVSPYLASGKVLYCPTVNLKYDSDKYTWSKWSTNGGNVIQYQYYGGTYRKHSTGWNSPYDQCPDRVSDPGNFLLMSDIVGKGNPAICDTTNMAHLNKGKVVGANFLFLNGSVIWYPIKELTVSPASDWLIPDIKRVH